MLARLATVHGHPTDPAHKELGPAVVAWDLPRSSLGRQRKSDRELGRDSDGARHPDHQRVKVGAISGPRVTSEEGIAPTPALAGFVVLHGPGHVVVDRARLVDLGRLSLRDF